VPDDLSVVVSGNIITMVDSERAALACLGACTNSTWTNNIVSGSGRIGIYVTKAVPAFVPPPEGYLSCNSCIANRLSGFTADTAQVSVDGEARDNRFSGNVFGHVDLDMAVAGVSCDGRSNAFVENDYRQSGIPGWRVPASSVGCLYLSGTSRENTVIESGNFPLGTGGARYQCQDAGTDNRIAGLEAGRTADPGIGEVIGRRKKAADAAMRHRIGSLPPDGAGID
jgi:hypothetical protein